MLILGIILFRFFFFILTFDSTIMTYAVLPIFWLQTNK